MQNTIDHLSNEIREMKHKIRSLGFKSNATLGRIIEFNRAFDQLGIDVDALGADDTIADDSTSTPVNTHIPLWGFGESISYNCLPRIIAIAGLKGMSLGKLRHEATVRAISLGEDLDELEGWASEHLADICIESQQLGDPRLISDSYFWALLDNVAKEAEVHNYYLDNYYQ